MRLLSAAVTALLALALPAVGGAAPTWLPAQTVSEAGEENSPGDVAVAPDGTAIVVWQRASCKNVGDPHECENGKVQYSVRPPGGSFSPPADMQGDPFAASMANPKVAVDAAGNAVAVWVSGSGEAARVRYAFRPAGGEFGGAKTVADASGSSHAFPRLDVAPSGRAVVTFFRLVAAAGRASYAVRPAGGDFGPATSFAGDPGTTINQAPDIHLDAEGGGIANWASLSGGVFIRYATIAPGATEFGAAEALEKGAARLAMAPSGVAAMIWNVSGSATDLRYSFRAPGGGFGPPQTLPEAEGPLGPQVAVAADGSAVAAWSSLVPPDTYVHWAVAPPGGPFGPPMALGPGVEGVLGDLEVSEQGATLLLWTSTGGSLFEMHAALRPPGGVFGGSVALPGPPQGASLFGSAAGFDAAGDAAAIWTGLDPGNATPHDVPLLSAWLENLADPDDGVLSIWGLGVRPRRFSVRQGRQVRASRRYGAKIRFQLSGEATVRFAVQRPRPGVRVRLKGKNRCLPRSKRNLRRGGGRCTRFKRAGGFTRRNRTQGLNSIRFSGRLRGRALRRGRYRLVAIASDSAGKRSKAARTGFRVRRR